MIRNQKHIVTNNLLPYIGLDYNPLSSEAGSCAMLKGLLPEKGRLVPATSPYFGAGGGATVLYDAVNFRYTRNGSQESKLIHSVNSSGSKYRLLQKQGGGDAAIEIFPGNTSFNVLVAVPFFWQVGNRLFFSDGTTSYVFDGRSVRVAGFSRSTTAPTVSAVAAGSLTAATGLKACITWVFLDEASNRVHESSRSNVSSFQVLAAENLRVDIGALSAPSGATHWSAYVSELNGSNIYRRAATTAIGTTTVDISALPASTTPKAPIRNDPMPPSTVGCVAKNRIFLRDQANPNRFYFSALGEVEGLLNGSGPESFPGYGTNSVSDITNSDFVADREIRAMIEHDNVTFIFTEAKGYALIGEMNLLDSRSPRSLVKLQQFSEGCIGPKAICSTPYGLVWITTGRRLVLWDGGAELIDLGSPIQLLLEQIRAQNGLDKNGTDPFHTKLTFYQGDGRQWLVLNMHGFFDADNLFTIPIGIAAWSTFVCDFSILTSRKTGAWFDYNLTSGYSQTFQELDGTPFLISESQSLGSLPQPLYFNELAQLGKTVLGTATDYANNAGIAYTFRPNLITPTQEWVDGHYLTITMGDQNGPNSAISTGTTIMWTDIERPYNIGVSSATITADTALSSGEVRLWLVPQASGNTNVGGSRGKRFVAQLSKTSGIELDNQVNSHRVLYHCIYGLGFSYSPQKQDAQ